MICPLAAIIESRIGENQTPDNPGHKLLALSGNHASLEQVSLTLRLAFST